MYSIIGLLKDRSVKRYYIFCISSVCFLASANYWTLHNLLFIVCVLLLYLPVIKDSIIIKEIFSIVRQHRLITVMIVLCMVCWGGMLISVFLEQHSAYGRSFGSIGYTIAGTVERARDGNMPTFLVNELFNPVVGGFGNEIFNYIHNARYIGAMLLPLIIISFFYRTFRVEFFQKLSILMFMICTIPGFLLPIWKIIFNFDQHYFYFYSHFWEISVLFMAVVSFDIFINDKDFKIVKINFLILVAAVAFLILTSFEREPSRALPLMLALIIIAAFLLKKYRESTQKIWLVLFLIVFLGDMSRYYYESSAGDHQFTVSAFLRESEGSESLFRPFDSEMDNTFSQKLWESSPPVQNHIWPYDNYLPPVSYAKLREATEDVDFLENVDYSFADGQDVHFHLDSEDYDGHIVYMIGSRMREASYDFTKCSYNDFVIDCSVPQDGYIVFNVLYDPKWQVQIDGEKVDFFQANMNYLSVEVAGGEHIIEMSYQPMARKIYPIASILLMGIIMGIGIKIKKEGDTVIYAGE